MIWLCLWLVLLVGALIFLQILDWIEHPPDAWAQRKPDLHTQRGCKIRRADFACCDGSLAGVMAPKPEPVEQPKPVVPRIEPGDVPDKRWEPRPKPAGISTTLQGLRRSATIRGHGGD